MSIVKFGCSEGLCVSQSVSLPSSHKGYYSANGISGSKADNECNRNLEFHFAPPTIFDRLTNMFGADRLHLGNFSIKLDNRLVLEARCNRSPCYPLYSQTRSMPAPGRHPVSILAEGVVEAVEQRPQRV